MAGIDMHTSRRTRHTIALGALCVTALFTGMLLTGAGPADAQADEPAVQSHHDAAKHVQVAEARLVPGVAVDTLMELELHCNSVLDDTLIERSTGTVQIDTPDGEHITVETSVKDVRPGSTTVTTVQVTWDECASSHRSLRRGVETAVASWTPESIRTVVIAAEPMPPCAAHKGRSTSPVRTSAH